MEFRTKREAEEAIQRLEQNAARWDEAAIAAGIGCPKMQCEEWAAERRAEAARIRALLPTLPD